MNDSSRDATLAQWKLLTNIAAEVAEERGVRRIGSQTAMIVERQIREWRTEERGQWDKLITVAGWLQRKLRTVDVSAVPTAAWERSLSRKQRSAARMVIFAASAVNREPAAAAAAPAVATAADLRPASPGGDNACGVPRRRAF